MENVDELGMSMETFDELMPDEHDPSNLQRLDEVFEINQQLVQDDALLGRNDLLWDFPSLHDATQWINNMNAVDETMMLNNELSVNSLFKGRIFRTKEAVIVACQRYSVLKRVEFHTLKSDTTRLVLVCREKEGNDEGRKCEWYVRAIYKKKGKHWEITQLNNVHTCENDIIPMDSIHFNKLFIASEVSENIREDIRLAPRHIKQMMFKKYGYDITYKKAWKVRQKALELLFGEWNESFTKMGPYLNAMVFYNPGSYVKVDTTSLSEGTSAVNKVFWAFGAAFKQCRPVISIDGTHLYGKYQGVLMIAIGFDGNDHLIPLAFAVVEQENNENWAWFMSCIREGVTQRTELCVVSDRHIGITNAMKRREWSPPNAYHRVCARHLASNFKTKVKDKQLRQQLKRVAYQNQKKKVLLLFNDLKECLQDNSVVRWLQDLPLELWTLAFDEGGRRWGAMSTNSSECYNNVLRGGRDLPITALIDYTLKQNNDYFTRRRDMYLDHPSIYVPKVYSKLELLKSKARGHDVEVYDREKMIVKVTTARNRNVHVVNVDEKTCTCGKWQLYHCSHLLAVCQRERLGFRQFVASEYLMTSFKKTWESKFTIMEDECYWPTYTGDHLVPNSHFRRYKVGRHPTQRIPNEMDGRGERQHHTPSTNLSEGASSSRPKTARKCSICGELGHNRRSCAKEV